MITFTRHDPTSELEDVTEVYSDRLAFASKCTYYKMLSGLLPDDGKIVIVNNDEVFVDTIVNEQRQKTEETTNKGKAMKTIDKVQLVCLIAALVFATVHIVMPLSLIFGGLLTAIVVIQDVKQSGVK